MKLPADIPLEQQAIRSRCFHPSGEFDEFTEAELDQSIPQRFEKIVHLYPDRPAVKINDQKLTYNELNRQANQLARAILARQANDHSPILLLLDTSHRAIIAVMAALKAGRIYVPLDTTFPTERLTLMAQDCATNLIVTDSKSLALAESLATRGVDIIDANAVDGEDATDLRLDISPDARASIFYTSGSTGHPKGVVQTHLGILHRVMAYANLFHVCAQDRLTLLHSYCAASAMHNLFSALLTGASLHGFSPKDGTSRTLADWLIAGNITIYHSIPALFRQMTSSLNDGERLPHLRAVNLSAAPMGPAEITAYKNHCSPAATLTHLLGGTESGFICCYFMDHQVSLPTAAVPVGFALPGKRLAIVNDAGQGVDPLEPGEIVVQSRYLAEGYWQRPELTAAKFSSGPSGGRERYYRTGDIGLMSPDGCLTHSGRKDFLVKIHGYRIETEEVERALLDHPAIHGAAVVARPGLGQDQRLVAYYVAADQSPALASELRAHLRTHLPPYMVPSRFIRQDSLPLTPNGKLDRNALPDPGSARPELSTPYVPPRNATERILAQLWEAELHLDRVGVDDNFFESGGHSLAASKIVARAMNHFRVRISLQALFGARTVAKMAKIVEESEAKAISTEDLEKVLNKLESLSEVEAKERLERRG